MYTQVSCESVDSRRIPSQGANFLPQKNSTPRFLFLAKPHLNKILYAPTVISPWLIDSALIEIIYRYCSGCVHVVD